MNFKRLSFLLLFGLLLFACGDDDENENEKEDVCETTDVTYTNTIASIFNASCAVSGCHVDGNEMNAWFSLEGYANAKSSADFGRLVGAVAHEEDFSPMPKNGNKLAQCAIDQITAWVADGAPE